MTTISRQTALDQQMGVRPDVVARARFLAADPDYPPMNVLLNVAAEILASGSSDEKSS